MTWLSHQATQPQCPKEKTGFLIRSLVFFAQHDTAVPKQASYSSFFPLLRTHPNQQTTTKCAFQGNHLPLIPRSIFIKRLIIESRLSPCLISILVEKWPLDGWGFTRETATPG